MQKYKVIVTWEAVYAIDLEKHKNKTVIPV